MGEEYWLESVYRGFTRRGIDLFANYSCVGEDHPMFCPQYAATSRPDKVKACIINHFEHDLARKAGYDCDRAYGLYPTDAPEFLRSPEHAWKTTWIKNAPYWNALVAHVGFPIAKANEPEQAPLLSGGRGKGKGDDGFGEVISDDHRGGAWRNHPLLRNCTKHFPPMREFVVDDDDDDDPGYESSSPWKHFRRVAGVPYYQREWRYLPERLQSLARNALGYNERSWNEYVRRFQLRRRQQRSSFSSLLSNYLSPTNYRTRKTHRHGLPASWEKLSADQQNAALELECSKFRYQNKLCLN